MRGGGSDVRAVYILTDRMRDSHQGTLSRLASGRPPGKGGRAPRRRGQGACCRRGGGAGGRCGGQRGGRLWGGRREGGRGGLGGGMALCSAGDGGEEKNGASLI